MLWLVVVVGLLVSAGVVWLMLVSFRFLFRDYLNIFLTLISYQTLCYTPKGGVTNYGF